MKNVSDIGTIKDCQGMREDWNKLPLTSTPSIKDIGVCSTYEWMLSLEQLNQDKVTSLVIANQHDGLLGVMPLYKENTFGFLGAVTLKQYDELHATRSGCLVGKSDHQSLTEMMTFLVSEKKNWAQLHLTVIDGSAEEATLHNVIQRLGLSSLSFKKITSPYIELEATAELVLANFNKKFRYNLGYELRKLEKVGKVSLKVYEKEEDVDEYLNIVYEIERQSWKEKAGTSITANPNQQQFYDTFTPLAARNGWLRGMVLLLDEQPIAYSYDMYFNNVVECLKTSFSNEYQKFSIGNILRLKIVEYLCEHNIKYYDLLGQVEQTKKRWTEKTYSQNTYVIFNNSFRGRLNFALKMLKSRIKGYLTKNEDDE